MDGGVVVEMEEDRIEKTLDSNVEQQVKEDSQSNYCGTCKKNFKSNLAYSRHLLKCRNKINECYICETDFKNAEELKLHHIDHHDGQIFVCLEEKCFCAFSTKKGLTYHTNVDHSEKSFDCETCTQSFSTQEELATHHKSPEHKTKTKQRRCQGCVISSKVVHSTLRDRSNAKFVTRGRERQAIFWNIYRVSTTVHRNFYVHDVYSTCLAQLA